MLGAQSNPSGLDAPAASLQQKWHQHEQTPVGQAANAQPWRCTRARFSAVRLTPSVNVTLLLLLRPHNATMWNTGQREGDEAAVSSVVLATLRMQREPSLSIGRAALSPPLYVTQRHCVLVCRERPHTVDSSGAPACRNLFTKCANAPQPSNTWSYMKPPQNSAAFASPDAVFRRQCRQASQVCSPEVPPAES